MLLGKTKGITILSNKYDWNKIGQRIKKARELAGLSQGELGEKISYGYQMIGKWERGETRPSLDSLFSLCNVFNCEIGYLLCEYDSKTRESTDIQAVTGLSERAIEILSDFNGRQMDSDAVSKLMQTINFLIEHEDEQSGSVAPLETISAMLFTRFGCGKILFVDANGEMQLAQSREEFSSGDGEVLFASEADFAVMEKMGEIVLREIRDLKRELAPGGEKRWLDSIRQEVQNGQHS